MIKLKKVILSGVPYIIVFSLGVIITLYLSKGEQSMRALMYEVSALAYIENNEYENARKMLQRGIESNLLMISRYGTPVLYGYDASAKDEWIKRYANIREQYPEIDYGDEGKLSRKIESILTSAKGGGEIVIGE